MPDVDLSTVDESVIREVVRDELKAQSQTAMDSIPFTRREIVAGFGILGAGATLGAYGAVGRAAASNNGSGTIGTSENPVSAIYVDELYQNTDHITAETLTTEEASIAGQQFGPWGFERVERLTPSSDQTEFDFTALSADRHYILFYSVESNEEGTFEVTFNGVDETGNEAYKYVDKTSFEQEDQDGIMIAEVDNSTDRFVGYAEISVTWFGNNSGRGGLNNTILTHRRLGDYSREGQSTELDTFDSMKFSGPDFSGGDTLVELWERDYS